MSKFFYLLSPPELLTPKPAYLNHQGAQGTRKLPIRRPIESGYG